MNLLITTLGTSWGIVPELLAFTNPQHIPLFKNHPEALVHTAMRIKAGITPVSEVWIATTCSKATEGGLAMLDKWSTLGKTLPSIRVFKPAGVSELASVKECELMRELVFRLVLCGAEKTRLSRGKLFLSLAGGRKTMSADMHTAAEHFGCNALLHVVDLGQLPDNLRNPSPAFMLEEWDRKTAACFSPILVNGRIQGRPILDMADPKLTSSDYPPDTGQISDSIDLQPRLIDRIRNILDDAANLHINFSQRLLKSSELSNFHGLYSLPPRSIDELQNSRIGGHSVGHAKERLQWLKQLPKAELHCHLGGILSPEELILVAHALEREITEWASRDPSFAHSIRQFDTLGTRSMDGVIQAFPDWKKVRDKHSPSRRHLHTAAFILYALKDPDRIHQYIYRGLTANSSSFRSIGIDCYEKLGDLQGSSLLQCETAIRETAKCLIRRCKEDNIRYLELRCSPHNCTNAGLSAEKVVQILNEELHGDPDACKFRLIFIASRHGEMSSIENHIELAQIMRKTDPDGFPSWFAGFDIAGAEYAKSPGELRGIMRPVMQECLNLTIHAGEGEPSDNIWEAVYELNADRIGHGLSLVDNPNLLARIRNRRISIELCPSSNYQIVGFKDFTIPDSSSLKPYPLRQFLNAGIRTTINTDDPGMSFTDLTHEFHKAACMTEEGLSKWEVLQLIRNSFKAAFLDATDRKNLILDAEKQILSLIE